MPTYRIEGQITEKATEKTIAKANVTLRVVINEQTIQETKANIEQDGFFRMSFYNEFIPEGTTKVIRQLQIENQIGSSGVAGESTVAILEKRYASYNDVKQTEF